MQNFENKNRSYNSYSQGGRPSSQGTQGGGGRPFVSGGPSRGYQGGDSAAKPAGEGTDNRRPMTFAKKKFVYRKKECYYTKNRIPYVDYKDVTALKNFVGFSGQILANRFTGLKPIYQRRAAKAIKRARFMALLPFVGEVKKASYRRDVGDGRGRYQGGNRPAGNYGNADATAGGFKADGHGAAAAEPVTTGQDVNSKPAEPTTPITTPIESTDPKASPSPSSAPSSGDSNSPA